MLNGITVMNLLVYAINAPGPQGDGARGIDGGENLAYAYMDTADGVYMGSGYITSNSGITVFGNHIISNCIVRNCSLIGGNAAVVTPVARKASMVVMVAGAAPPQVPVSISATSTIITTNTSKTPMTQITG